MAELAKRLAAAREISWQHHGRKLTVATPGMFVAYGRRGRYPAVSLTGSDCAMGCGHCGGRLLEPMPPARSGEELLALGRRLWSQGQEGMLLSGGSDCAGRLPWPEVLPAIRELAHSTGLILTAHVGRIDGDTARALKEAGVRQALYDVVGDAETARRVLGWPDGLAWQEETLAACKQAGLEVVPHIIVGLHYGEIRGEARALEIVAGLEPQRLVLVVLMPLKGTALAQVPPPPAREVASLLALARQRLPRARHHLGCARPRGRYRQELDPLAVAAGVNVMALPSDAGLDRARELGVEVSFCDTCCSLV